MQSQPISSAAGFARAELTAPRLGFRERSGRAQCVWGFVLPTAGCMVMNPESENILGLCHGSRPSLPYCS